ncbi:AI-2E family transporter [Piscinibacter sakaiensis]|uniref:AI-2E family transporter n=1 Tax=Piscinibacter sakaiensis TaxID=1547922 RepID=UPI003AAC9579
MARDISAATLWRLLATVVLLALVWHLRQPVMLLFGAVLIAASLRALANPLADRTRLSPRLATGVVLLTLSVVLGLGLWLLGRPLAEQFQALGSELPRAWANLREWLTEIPLGDRLLVLIEQTDTSDLPWEGIAGVAGTLASGMVSLLLIVLMGLYLAFDVYLYRNGLLRLFPPRRRRRVAEALDSAGHALTRWLLGQALTMVLVGVAVAVGLSLLQMPLALALGLTAGLLEFVPFFGPIASGLLAVLVAFVEGPQQALYVALLFLVIQQVEGNVVVPLVQRWAVQLPPVLAVASVVVFGTLFGIPGIVFGTPLMVVAMVLVRKLYIEQTLEAGRMS